MISSLVLDSFVVYKASTVESLSRKREWLSLAFLLAYKMRVGSDVTFTKEVELVSVHLLQFQKKYNLDTSLL